MAALRKFASLASHAHFLDERVAAMVPIGAMMAAKGTRILEREVKSGYGKHDLAELAQATQDDRVAKGYTPDDPLLRDGALLRDSTQSETGEDFSGVGTDEPVAMYQEFGYWNVRAQCAVPPRSVYRNALVRVGPPIIVMIEEAIGVDLGFTPSLSSDLETQTATYALTTSEE